MKLEELLTPVQFAAQANISIAQVYALIRANRINSVLQEKGVGSRKMIPKSELKKIRT